MSAKVNLFGVMKLADAIIGELVTAEAIAGETGGDEAISYLGVWRR